MADLVHNNYHRSRFTKFVAVNWGGVNEAISIFGNYTPQGDTPIVWMPTRSSCAPYIVIPEGCHALVTKHGSYVGVWDPGFHWCMPYTQIQYLITKQNFQFDCPVRNCPSHDNVHIQIEVSIIMKVLDSDDDIQNFCYKTSVSQLNEQLDANISERIRVLVRSKKHTEAYSIKGKEHTQEMIRYMNGIFEPKGIQIKSVIITNVRLPHDIADEMEEKTTYATLNTLERKQQCFELREINDNQEKSLKEEMMKQGRQAENERFNKLKAEIEKEADKIQADTDKIVAEISEKTKAEVNKINAKSELDAQEVKAETKMIKASFTADGRAKINELLAECEAYCLRVKAEAEQKAAEMIAEETKIRGRAEGTLSKHLSSRRRHDKEMAKLGVLKELAENRDLSIYGTH